MTRTVGIVGLGQVGGSLAAALRSGRDGWTVRAFDRRLSGVAAARDRGWVDAVAETPREAAEGADLVVLAAPVRGIRQLLRTLAPALVPGQVVTDVGSTKATILAEARKALPEGVAFVGGHPVAGTERSGLDSASPRLFEGRYCVLTPEPDTPAGALETVAGLWRAVGSEVVLLEPEVHDRVFAYVSHLPHAVAFAAVQAVHDAVTPRQVNLGGGSLRDLTRVATSSPELWRDVCLENRTALLEAIDDLVDRLGRLREAVDRADEREIERLLVPAGRARRTMWTP